MHTSRDLVVSRIRDLKIYIIASKYMFYSYFPDQDAAAGHLLHRLPDQRAEVRRPQQWGRGLQGRHPQEVEREVTRTETKRIGETAAANIIILIET